MMNLIRIEIKRGMWNPRWLLIGLAALASFWAGWLRMPYSENGSFTALDQWVLILNYGLYPYGATLLAGLPYVDTLLNDRREGVLRYLCLRRPYAQCLAAKIFTNLVCGALAVALPPAILAGALLLRFPHTTNGLYFTVYQPGFPFDPLTWLFERPYLYLGTLILLAAAFGATCASFGMALSTWLDNPGWVLASPFVAFTLLVYLAERARSLNWLGDPWAAILPYARPEMDAGRILLQYTCVILLCMFTIILFGAKERMLSGTDEGGRQ